MNKIALFVMVKNEEDFIEQFLNHNLPIFDEATIIDNGSSDKTLDIIKSFSSNSCKIIERPGKYEKAKICTEYMQQSDAEILIPLDADELIVYDDGNMNSISSNPNTIRKYIQELKIKKDGERFKIRKYYQKNPQFENWWGVANINKVFFSKEGFIATDAGNHKGIIKNKNSFDLSNLSYLDYRYFSQKYWEKRTIEKLKSRLKEKWNDLQTLMSFTGVDSHAARQYLEFMGYRRCNMCNKYKEIEHYIQSCLKCMDCDKDFNKKLNMGKKTEKKGTWNKVKKQFNFKINQ